MSKDKIIVQVNGKSFEVPASQEQALLSQLTGEIKTNSSTGTNEVEVYDLDGSSDNDIIKTKTIHFRIKGVQGERYPLEITEEEYEKYQNMSSKERSDFIKSKLPKGFIKQEKEKFSKQLEQYNNMSNKFGNNPKDDVKLPLNGKDGVKDITFTAGNQKYFNKILEKGDYKEIKAFLQRMYDGPYIQITGRSKNGLNEVREYITNVGYDDAKPRTRTTSGRNSLGMGIYTKEKDGVDLQRNWYWKDGIEYPITDNPNVRILDIDGTLLESNWENIDPKDLFFKWGTRGEINARSNNGWSSGGFNTDFTNPPSS